MEMFLMFIVMLFIINSIIHWLMLEFELRWNSDLFYDLYLKKSKQFKRFKERCLK